MALPGLPGHAVAQAPTGQGKAAAEALFREGRALLEQGELEQACAKLDQSLRLDRSPGTLLNLADCHARQGRTATAWAEFLEAARLAQDTGWQAGSSEAKRRAETLEPSLSRLTVQIGESVDGLVISLDGTSLEQAALGSGLPIDPGEHALSAEAPGRKRWSARVRIVSQGVEMEVVVPALEVGEGAMSGSDAGEGDTLAAAETDGASGEPSPSGSVLPYVIGGVGIAAIAAGSVFGLLAKGNYEDAEKACPDRTGCSKGEIDMRDDAELQANLANVGFGVGIVALGVAVVLLVTGDDSGPSEDSVSAASPRLSFSAGTTGASLSGRF
jgi:tetratricopeptide (TPR) repeat protein